MLVIRTNDGNNRAWTIGAPRPAFTVPELHSIIHVNVFGPELDCLRLRLKVCHSPRAERARPFTSETWRSSSWRICESGTFAQLHRAARRLPGRMARAQRGPDAEVKQHPLRKSRRSVRYQAFTYWCSITSHVASRSERRRDEAGRG